MAWLEDGVKVNVSLQPASIHSSNDPTILNYEKQFQSSNNRDSFVYNKYEQEDHGLDHVISTGRQMTNLVSNFEYLVLLSFLTEIEF